MCHTCKHRYCSLIKYAFMSCCSNTQVTISRQPNRGLAGWSRLHEKITRRKNQTRDIPEEHRDGM